LVGRLLLPFGNLTSLSALACVGGGVGFLARRMEVGPIGSAVAAASTGLAAAYAVGGLLGYLARSTAYAAPLETHGTVGTVLHRITEKGTGEVAYTHQGARATLPAVSANGRAIEAGIEVVVLDIRDGVAKVAPSAEVFGERSK
jgi:hypothetical protein